MFSTNLKRSVATLGVVAGLLAAAVPGQRPDRPRQRQRVWRGSAPNLDIGTRRETRHET